MDLLEERIIESVREILNPLIVEQGLELVDIEYRKGGKGGILRIFIDKEGGVTIGDCTRLSRELSTLLDIYDFIPGPYTLEVSSPGLNRVLKKPEDFKRFRGKKVKIKTRTATGEKKLFIGKLLDFRDNSVYIEVGKNRCSIPLEEIERANLEVEF
ncbi:MAG: ribosome maturation factor [Deltaproteobacteria bacterium]|jgi:ribosome maturation factor RimP|nr:MAG: ribosome maturation factor [Deltaproteobacteria bacterium]